MVLVRVEEEGVVEDGKREKNGLKREKFSACEKKMVLRVSNQVSKK